MFSRLLRPCVIAAALLLSFHAGSIPAETAVGTYQTKAALIHNVAMFVEWPGRSFVNDQSPIVATILGDCSQDAAFHAIQGKTAKNREIQVRPATRVEEVGGSHILFICASERQQLAHILESVKDRSILTVSDMKHFAKGGGIISFIPVDEKTGFDVNLAAAQKAHLKISSQLLKLARTVVD